MKKYSKRKIESSLKISIDQMNYGLKSPYGQNKEEEKIMKEKKSILLPILIPAFVVTLVLAAFGYGLNYYNKNFKVDSTITIDVNPSITLSTNPNGIVIKVEAVNDDGEEILKDLEIVDMDMQAKEAMTLIVDKLITEGYLEGDGANLLLTVQNNDLVKAKEIESELSTYVNTKFDENYIAGTVLTQVDTVRKNIDEDIKTMMAEYDISYSKAIFIRNVLRKNSALTVEELAPLKINEISKLINDKGIDITDIVGYDDNDNMYEIEELKQLKKTVDAAEKAKIQAQIKVEQALNKLENKQNKNENTTNEENEYSTAEQERIRAEKEAEEAHDAYEEAEQERNESSTNNQDRNQNENSQENGGSTSSGGNRR